MAEFLKNIISEENKQILITRSKSFLWRLGGMVGSVTLAFIAENLSLFTLPGWLVVVLGLVIGEVTKQLNK